MPVRFNPVGILDVATDPSDLPEEVKGKTAVSTAMRRCKNLHTDKAGVASTRPGSSKVNSSAVDELSAHHLAEQAGTRYLFAGDQIYEDESSIDSGNTDARWSSLKYNPYNSSTQSVFALNGTDRKKIEGSTVYKWGIAAPSAVPVLLDAVNGAYCYDWETTSGWYQTTNIETCEDTSGWSVDPSGGTLSTTTDNQQGTYAIQAHWNNESDTEYIAKFDLGAGEDWSSYDFISFYFKIETNVGGYYAGDLFYFEFGEATYNEQSFGFSKPAGNQWVKIQIGISSVASASRDAVRYFQVRREFSAASSRDIRHRIDGFIGYGATIEPYLLKFTRTWTNTDDTNYEYEYIYDWEDEQLDSLTAGSNATNYRIMWWFELESDAVELTSQYYVRYTYVRKSGSTVIAESDPSDVAYLIPEKGFYIQWAQPDDAQVTHVRFYRSLADGTTTYYAQEFEVDTLVGGLWVQDNDLGSEVATDHDRPPAGTICMGPYFDGYCFIIKDNFLYYSKSKQPEYWPTSYYLEPTAIQEPLKSGVIWNGQLFVLSEYSMFMIQGTGASSFNPLPVQATTGTLHHEATLGLQGYGIYRVATDGIWVWSGGQDRNITDPTFLPIWKGTTTNGMTGMNTTNIANCRLLHYKQKIWFGYPGLTATYPDNFLVFNLVNGRVNYYDYGTEFRAWCVDKENDRILAIDTAGYVWVLDDSTATDDDGTDISWEVESKAFSDQVRKYFPRYAKYDVTVGSGASVTGTILLNDASHQTHTISTSRQTKRRLIDEGNGDRLGLKISGTGSVDIYAMEVE